MTDKMVYVYAHLKGQNVLVGRLWSRARKGKESASFEYDQSWLARRDRFALEPQLQLTAGAFHTADKSLFGSIGDSAPDRWGRVLMRRAANRAAEENQTAGQTLLEIDYLLGVNDTARQGALRFSSEPGGPFLADAATHPIPPMVDLPKLLSASENVIENTESHEDLAILLAPGSSLGGARPKASVIDGRGRLYLAKFPRKDDEYNTVKWEAVALKLAESAGISTPEWQLTDIAGKSTLLLARFDRNGSDRIPFVSAMSMLGARDGDLHSYMEIVDAIRQVGASPKADLVDLWRRIVFSVLISNTDDHLRNHAMLYTGRAGWRLSPVYDVNPTPIDMKPRMLSTAIDLDDNTASLDLAMSVADYFGVSNRQAKTIVNQAAKATAQWRAIAQQLGVAKSEIERMASAFQHQDLEWARGKRSSQQGKSNMPRTRLTSDDLASTLKQTAIRAKSRDTGHGTSRGGGRG